MMAILPPDHPPELPDKVGVLLLNLGTPDSTGYWDMRRYLKEFLSDQRVIEVNPFFWKILLNVVILTKRPFSSGEAYEKIWNKERDESPLRTITREQCEKLASLLKDRFDDSVVVDWGMRYGNPSTASRIEALQQQGCQRILLFPLYPQYAAATTGTACDQAFRALMKTRWQPAVRTVPAYHDHPGYIQALAHSVERHLATLDWEPDVLVTSFHGLPKRYLLAGDPYHCQCQKTARLLRETLGWPEDRLQIAFQSLFGKEEWLRPYTVDHVATLAKTGKTKLAIIAPGFSADCVETLEEIQEEIREAFEEAGGERFTYIPCLNADDDHIAVLADITTRELSGWVGAVGAADGVDLAVEPGTGALAVASGG
ncbi:MAG: ferrochelatase [Alphaproteobacteria bacterium]|nr:ferrochelatase [Alphaproteobacteria bacterium]